MLKINKKYLQNKVFWELNSIKIKIYKEIMKKEIVVIGIGRYAKELIKKLNNVPGCSIVAIDKDQSKLEQLQGVKNIIVGDATNADFLTHVGIDNADFFVIGMGQDFQGSLVITTLLAENFKGHIIAKSVNEQHESILRKIGVEDVITPEIAAAKRTFNKIVNPLALKGVSDFEMSEIADGVSVAKIPVLEKWNEKMISELELSNEIGITLIFKNNKAEIVNGQTIVNTGDILVVAGKDKSLIKLLEMISAEYEQIIFEAKQVDITSERLDSIKKLIKETSITKEIELEEV